MSFCRRDYWPRWRKNISDLLQPPAPDFDRYNVSKCPGQGSSEPFGLRAPFVCDLSEQGLKFVRHINISNSRVVGQVIVSNGDDGTVKEPTSLPVI